MRQIPKQIPAGATQLTPLEMNAIHFGGRQSPATKPGTETQATTATQAGA